MGEKKKYSSVIFNAAFKLIVSLLLIYFVTSFIYKDADLLSSFKNYDSDRISPNIHFLLFAILLMPINWFLESFKWKLVMHDLKQIISLKEAFRSILIGVTLGMVTPVRIGEYVGRSVNLDRLQVMPSFLCTFLCSLAQNFINIILGIFAFQLFIDLSNFELDNEILIVTNLVVLILGLWVYFNVDKVMGWLCKFKFLNKYLKDILPYKFAYKLLSKVLWLSFLRYCVYLTQFYLALRFFDLYAPIQDCIGAIASIFLVQSSVPMPPIMDLFARGEIAIIFLSVLKFNLAGLLLASGLLWVINLILPAFVGLVLLLKVNVSKILTNENE